MSQVDTKLIYPLSLIIFIIFGVFNYAIGKKIVLPFHVLLVKTLLVLCKKKGNLKLAILKKPKVIGEEIDCLMQLRS